MSCLACGRDRYAEASELPLPSDPDALRRTVGGDGRGGGSVVLVERRGATHVLLAANASQSWAAAAQEEDEEDAWASDKENETDAVVMGAVKAKLTSLRRLDRLFGSDASNRVYSPQNWNGKRRKLSGLAAAPALLRRT